MVTIVSSPAGTPVSGPANTFDYPIFSNVTLTCMLDPPPSATVVYRWNTTGCYSNSNYTGVPCFPRNQMTQDVTGTGLTAKDAGTITCTVTFGTMQYTSAPFTLRISGELYYNT